MKRTFSIALWIILLCSGVNSYSQKHIGNYNQLFLQGNKSPAENIDAFLQAPDIDRDEVIGNKFYRLIQFFEIPTDQQKRDIEEAGIILLDYIPHKTYLAAIPETFRPELLVQLNIRNISRLPITDKISPALYDQEKVVLQFYKNLTPEFVKLFLENKNVEIFEFRNNAHAVVVCTDASEYVNLAKLNITQYLEPAETAIFPEYVPGRNLHRSNVLTPTIEGFPQYNGDGIKIAIGDDGLIEPHIDFKDRIDQSEVSGDTEGNHGEMVTGILAGAGNLDPRMTGTASRASIHMYHEFDAVKQADLLFQNEGISITTTSYSDGCNRGYTSFAQLVDYQLNNTPSLMHVFSAGNAGNENCGYGAGNGWGNITGGVKMGKNVLAVGNVNPDDVRVGSSSRGPASDGRIKPDISANGDGQFSTQPNNTYGEASGSSAAAPGVAGVMAQLYQAWRSSHNNTLPNSALIKASLLNSADDLGNAGPDFSYGYGRINARRALSILQNENYHEGVIFHGSTQTIPLTIPQGTQHVRVLLYWHDAAGSPLSAKALVNDLDLKMLSPSDETFHPWVLQHSPNPAILNLPATRGVDDLNNVEQITIDNPESGDYSIKIKGSEVPLGIQKYFVVYEFLTDDITLTFPIGGEKLVPGEIEKIHWDAFGNDGNFEIEISHNNGNTWQLLDQVSGDKRSWNWQVPAVASSQNKIRISRSGKSKITYSPFTISKIPQNLHVAQVCPSNIRLEWDPVSNASNYIIYKLGEKYMEFFGTTLNPYLDIPIDNPNKENWYAVQSQSDGNLISRRTIAVSDGTELFNCELANDISLHSFSSPANATLKGCFTDPISVGINITNTGTESQSNIPIAFQLNNENPVTEIYPGAIPPGITVNYVFNTTLPILNFGTHDLRTWTAIVDDQARFNDTLDFQINVIQGELLSLPYFQNFDNFTNCATDLSCETACNLTNGWNNDENGISDDIDWIVHNGLTPSAGTGPDADQNNNNAFGKYLFLEGSMGCTEQEAYLLSPCFKLENSSQPVFSFWYHMKGSDQGRLHIDVFDGKDWFYNIAPTIIGEQGNDWQNAEIDLSAFTNKIINIRLRGVTGDGFLTDMAIDNVAIFDAASEPYPNFKANNLITCTNQKIQFQDNSVNSPTQWLWEFQPNNITFTDGTSAMDANPSVIFNGTGFYDITLTASNNFGSSSITRSQYIEVNNGTPISFGDDFESILLDPEKWILSNNDNSITWSLTSVIGRDGLPTKTTFVNNYSYNATGEEDVIQSRVIDLSQTVEPYLRFDYAYAAFNENFSDGLRVTLSSDCGDYFEHILFEKDGDELATVINQNQSWAPRFGHEWKTAEIDLSEFIGNSVVIQFTNINGFGNNIYLDNFLVYENAEFPNAEFVFSPSENILCVGEQLSFSDNSTLANTLLWNFGENAFPNSAIGAGPHNITFDEPGTYHILLKAKNNLGYEVAEQTIEVLDDPIADFSYTIQNGQVLFENHSIYGTTFVWDFGDGNLSYEKNPIHTYSHSNAFSAKLTVINKCGQNITEQTIVVITGIEDVANNFFFTANPNPTFGEIIFNMPVGDYQPITFDLIDTRGIILSTYSLVGDNNLISHRLDLENLAQGVYFARVKIDNKVYIKRFIKI